MSGKEEQREDHPAAAAAAAAAGTDAAAAVAGAERERTRPDEAADRRAQRKTASIAEYVSAVASRVLLHSAGKFDSLWQDTRIGGWRYSSYSISIMLVRQLNWL